MKIEKLLKGTMMGASLAAFVAVGGAAQASDLLSSERMNGGYEQMGDEKKADPKKKDEKKKDDKNAKKGDKDKACGGGEEGEKKKDGEHACGEGSCG